MEYLLIVFGYLVGSIPFGLVLGKMAGIDVRTSGSGNIGATNVSRLLGKKMGVVTLLADAGKAVLPMLVASWVLSDSSHLYVYATGGAAFLGHLYPVYLKFKGGKGVATALGIFIYIQPIAIVFCLALFVGTVKMTGYVSLGSLLASALMPILVCALDGITPAFYLALFVAIFIWIKHHENIRRLLNHEENSFKVKGKG
nr:glycerol-3-phosphate 1-O-acyltransferase PlsY [Desulfobulbaceae bacterium]